jgi:AhpD family alkylhydroperoxidase
MTRRLSFAAVAPGDIQALLALTKHAHASGLEESLLELVQVRASYLNGCAYCIDMHTKDARAAGESEQRLYAVPVWRETPFFSARERAVLAWTEAVTRLGPEGVSDAIYEEAAAHFTPAELAHLTLAVSVINAWNRINVAFRTPAGTYVPGAHRMTRAAS